MEISINAQQTWNEKRVTKLMFGFFGSNNFGHKNLGDSQSVADAMDNQFDMIMMAVAVGGNINSICSCSSSSSGTQYGKRLPSGLHRRSLTWPSPLRTYEVRRILRQ